MADVELILTWFFLVNRDLKQHYNCTIANKMFIEMHFSFRDVLKDTIVSFAKQHLLCKILHYKYGIKSIQ